MDKKEFDALMKRKLTSMSDEILLDNFRQCIDAKENTRQDILKLFTLSFSGDDNTFVSQIQEQLAELQKIVKNSSSCSDFTMLQRKCDILEKELVWRRYELAKVLSFFTENIWRNEIHICIHNQKTWEDFVVSPLFLQNTFDATTPVRTLFFSERLINGLELHGITTLWKVLERRKHHNIKNFVGMKHLWKKSYLELKEFLCDKKFIDN